MQSCNCFLVQLRHRIRVLNAWEARAKHTTVRLITDQFAGHGRMDGLATERSFDKQTTWVIDVLGLLLLTCYPWVFVEPGTGRRPVDWCRNQLSIL